MPPRPKKAEPDFNFLAELDKGIDTIVHDSVDFSIIDFIDQRLDSYDMKTLLGNRVVLKTFCMEPLDDEEQALLDQWVREEKTNWVDPRQIVQGQNLQRIVEEGLDPVDVDDPNELRKHFAWRELIVEGGMRGGKSLSGDTLVSTSHGLLRFDELLPKADGAKDEFYGLPDGIRFQTKDGSQPVFRGVSEIKQETLQLRTRNGFRVEGSKVHPMLVMTRQGKLVWKMLPEISKGDFLCVHRPSEGLFGTDGSPAIARVLGYLDSSAGQITRRGFCIRIDREDELDQVEHALETSFKVHRLQGRNPGIRANGLSVREQLAAWGCQRPGVPKLVRRGTREVVRQYLQVLFGVDAVVHVSGLRTSIELEGDAERLKHVQAMLLQFGVLAGLEENLLTLFGAEAHRFVQEIGFSNPEKKLGPLALRPGADIIPYLGGVLKRAERILHEDGTGKQKKDWASVKASIGKIRRRTDPEDGISYGDLDRVIGVLAGLERARPIVDHLVQLRRYHFFYDPVVEVTRGETYLYDVEVIDGHNFIANGLVSHNTQIGAFLTLFIAAQLISTPRDRWRETFGIPLPAGTPVYITCIAATADSTERTIYGQICSYMTGSKFFKRYIDEGRLIVTSEDIKFPESNLTIVAGNSRAAGQVGRVAFCLSGNTPVMTDRGPVLMKNLPDYPERKLLTLDGYVPFQEAWKTGMKPTYRLVTQTGQEIVGTLDHRLMTSPGEWKPLGQFLPGQSIILRLGGWPGTSNQLALDWQGFDADYPDNGLPRTVDFDLAWVLGAWLAGGKLVTRFKKGTRPFFTYDRMALRDAMKPRLEACFGKDVVEEAGGFLIDSKAAERWFLWFGLQRGRVPQLAWNLTEDRALALVSGYLAVRLGGNLAGQWDESEFFLGKDLSAFMVRLGLLPTVRHRRGTLEFYATQLFVNQLLSRVEAEQLCLRRIPAFEPVELTELFADKIRSVDETGKVEEVWDLSVPGPEHFTVDGIMAHNCCIFDEIAFHNNADGKSNGKDLYDRIGRSTTNLGRQAKIIAISSVREDGDFMEELQRDSWDKQYLGCLCFRLSTWDLNETLSMASPVIAKAYAADPVAAARDYENIRPAAEGAFLNATLVDMAIDHENDEQVKFRRGYNVITNTLPSGKSESRTFVKLDIDQIEKLPQGYFSVGHCDPGVSDNSFAFANGHAESYPNGIATIIDFVLDWIPITGTKGQVYKVDFINVEEVLLKVHQARNLMRLTFDHWNAEDHIQRLWRAGVPTYQDQFNRTRQTMGYMSFRDRLHAGLVRIPNHPTLVEEMKNLILKNGQTVDHPKNKLSHTTKRALSKDVIDCVMVVDNYISMYGAAFARTSQQASGLVAPRSTIQVVGKANYSQVDWNRRYR